MVQEMLAGARDSSPLQKSRTTVGPPSSLLNWYWGSCSGGKVPRHGVDLSTTSRTKNKINWNYNSTPSVCLCGRTGQLHFIRAIIVYKNVAYHTYIEVHKHRKFISVHSVFSVFSIPSLVATSPLCLIYANEEGGYGKSKHNCNKFYYNIRLMHLITSCSHIKPTTIWLHRVLQHSFKTF
jgi:hypothetical protein